MTSFVYTELVIGLNTVYTQLNVKTVLFETIQFSISTQLFIYSQLKDQTILFQTIQFFTSTKLNGSKYWYVSPTIQLNITYLFTNS